MQVGNILIKIVIRPIQKSSKETQYMVLAGFNPKMSHATADFYDTLSPNHVLTQADIDGAIAKLVKLSGAKGYTDVTNEGVQKKLRKLFEGAGPDAFHMGNLNFAGLGIGKYMTA